MGCIYLKKKIGFLIEKNCPALKLIYSGIAYYLELSIFRDLRYIFYDFTFVSLVCSSLLLILFSNLADSTSRKVWYPVVGNLFCSQLMSLYFLI